MGLIVAIDGPAGSGKSTVAKAVALAEDFTYLDTGAMYRTVALMALEGGYDLDDDANLGVLAQNTPIRFERLAGTGQQIFCGERNVTDAIRTPEVDKAVSPVSGAPSVRKVMVAIQREIAGNDDVIAEGRDIGTVVFPNAQVKVFLTATPQARADRRVRQNLANPALAGDPAATDFETVLAAIIARDAYDSTREHSPLRKADDAVEIDSSFLTVDQVVATIRDLVRAAR